MSKSKISTTTPIGGEEPVIDTPVPTEVVVVQSTEAPTEAPADLLPAPEFESTETSPVLGDVEFDPIASGQADAKKNLEA